MSSRMVAVFGATGHTGRFVVQELQRRGFQPVAVARDGAKLAAFGGIETRLATIDDPASLDRAFAGVAAVINCAGPFLDTALPVAEAAIRAGASYIDVTDPNRPAAGTGSDTQATEPSTSASALTATTAQTTTTAGVTTTN